MTREQQVAVDAMRSAWPEEVVARMLRAEDGRIESALLIETRRWSEPKSDGGLCLACGAWRGGRSDENHDHEDDCMFREARVASHAEAVATTKQLRATLGLKDTEPRVEWSLSPVETPTAASVSQPPGETRSPGLCRHSIPRHECVSCRKWLGPGPALTR